MLTGPLKASQHFFYYQDVVDDYQVICMLENKIARVSVGDIIEIKVSNRKPVRRDVQFWLENTIHNVVSVEENENQILIRVIKESTPKDRPVKDFKITKKSPLDCDNVINQICVSILKGEQVNLFFEQEGIMLLSNDKCKRSIKQTNTSPCNLQSHKDKLIQLNLMGVKFHVKSSELNEYNLNKNELLISNISVE